MEHFIEGIASLRVSIAKNNKYKSYFQENVYVPLSHLLNSKLPFMS